jgi:hypothetical protein
MQNVSLTVEDVYLLQVHHVDGDEKWKTEVFGFSPEECFEIFWKTYPEKRTAIDDADLSFAKVVWWNSGYVVLEKQKRIAENLLHKFFARSTDAIAKKKRMMDAGVIRGTEAKSLTREISMIEKYKIYATEKGIPLFNENLDNKLEG